MISKKLYLGVTVLALLSSGLSLPVQAKSHHYQIHTHRVYHHQAHILLGSHKQVNNAKWYYHNSHQLKHQAKTNNPYGNSNQEYITGEFMEGYSDAKGNYIDRYDEAECPTTNSGRTYEIYKCFKAYQESWIITRSHHNLKSIHKNIRIFKHLQKRLNHNQKLLDVYTNGHVYTIAQEHHQAMLDN